MHETLHKTCPLIFLILFFHISLTYSQEDTYDFIIIGGGTAGLCLARRLADNRFSVLVMESGDEPKMGSEIPAYSYTFIRDPQVTSRHNSVPQRNAALRNNGNVPAVSGRGLGGTSNLNQMLFNRGSPRDYDNWSNLIRDPSWDYSNMLKYFKRAETYQGDYPSDEHGYTGPLTISRPKYAPGLKFWLEAGQSLGYEVADPNGPQKISFTKLEFTKKMGRRVSSLDGYISPIRSTSSNLQIATNTNATKIIFNDSKRADGVRFQSTSRVLENIRPRVVFARNEIILSAGAYGSPLLLLRSGIGPAASLRKANIPVIKDLPVGLNLQDHVRVILPFIINSDTLIMDDERDLNQQNFKVYQSNGDGPYSCSRGTTGQAFIVSSVAKSEGEADWSDLQLVMLHSKQAYESLQLVQNGSVASGEGPMAATVLLTRPNSTGFLELDPKDPNGPPILDFEFFAVRKDMQKMLDGIDSLMQIFEKTPSYRKLEARFPRNLNLPECNKLQFRSREFWECYIKYTAGGGHHLAGTCRMGHPSERHTVVDSRFKVLGVNRLRVVDSSIMPVIVNANLQAAVYGIAEKASEVILEDNDYGY